MTWYKVGEALVDSGQLMIIDPCYVTGDSFTDEHYSDGSVGLHGRTPGVYETIKDGPAQFHGGVAFLTCWGDGSYPVYAQFKNGRVTRVMVDTDPKEDDDE